MERDAFSGRANRNEQEIPARKVEREGRWTVLLLSWSDSSVVLVGK